jgi:putative mRNA 3-end processing factor
MPPHPETWLRVTPQGLFCEPGDFFIDPVRAVGRAVITHGHADHARPGHAAVLATPETLAIMRARMGEGAAGTVQQAIRPGEVLEQNGVAIRLVPAGHVLGSAQVVLDWRGARAVVSGDYKRQRDPTCAPFEPVPCDVFVTEATFALPVFRHPDPAAEIGKLLKSLALFPERSHVVGCYALGKCQRLIRLLREAGWGRPIHLHGALATLCALYEALGVPLGPLAPATVANKAALAGAIVLAPPSAVQDRWARRLAEPVVAVASGWMRVRQRAKTRGVELPLVISDHADWDDLNRTIDEVAAPEVWVTHGRDDALVHALALRGICGRALHLVGLGDEEDDVPVAEAAPVPEAEPVLVPQAEPVLVPKAEPVLVPKVEPVQEPEPEAAPERDA